jgi:hypothetical protein
VDLAVVKNVQGRDLTRPEGTHAKKKTAKEIWEKKKVLLTVVVLLRGTDDRYDCVFA